jgi:hypothetical protein
MKLEEAEFYGECTAPYDKSTQSRCRCARGVWKGLECLYWKPWNISTIEELQEKQKDFQKELFVVDKSDDSV